MKRLSFIVNVFMVSLFLWGCIIAPGCCKDLHIHVAGKYYMEQDNGKINGINGREKDVSGGDAIGTDGPVDGFQYDNQ